MSENNLKFELIKKNIDRFDHYIGTTNAKSSIILAFNGIIIGAILLKYDIFIKLFEDLCWCLCVARVHYGVNISLKDS